jgi:hypothetical protein
VPPVVRLRVELADTPGSLADVASAIGSFDGNNVAIDALQSDGGGTVVDEITVELPDVAQLAELRHLISTRGAARVLSYQLATPVDRTARLLGRIAVLLDALPGDATEPLRQVVVEIAHTAAVWVMTPDEARQYEAGRGALRHSGTAVVGRTAESLPPPGESIRGEAAVLAVAASGCDVVVLVARSAEQGFTTTETSRVEAMAALYARLVGFSRAAAGREAAAPKGRS